MQYLERKAVDSGTTVSYNCNVTGLEKTGDSYLVRIEESARTGEAVGNTEELRVPIVINSAGLHADQIAAHAGIDIDEAGYRIHLCKGEYFKVSNRHRGKLKRLVYPAPTSISLGAHAALALDGTFKMGPSAFYVDRIDSDKIDYSVNPENRQEFYERSRLFLPFLTREDLTPDMSGVRPKLYGPGEPVADYKMQEESARGLPGLIDLIGMESPGVTACLAIADMVEDMVKQL
jgi:L-2-hydroxyglutarate oxidase LhgO